MTMNMSRIFGLDIMRSTAIIFVLISHSKFFFIQDYPGLRFLGIFGFLGVEIFFVLSGFLIGGILIRSINSNFGIRDFLVRRWFRTLPNYYLFLTINFLVYSFALSYPLGGWEYFIFTQNLFQEMKVPFVPESWSLSVEEWFYLITPIIIYALYKFTVNARVSLLTALLSIMGISIIARLYHVLSNNPTFDEGVRKIVVYRFDSLMWGILGAYIKYYYAKSWTKQRTFISGIGILLISIVAICFYKISRNESIGARVFLFSLTSASIFCFLPVLDHWKKTTLKAFGVIITSISTLSYSLYLCHLSFFRVMSKYANEIGEHNLILSITFLLIWLTLCFTISFFTYKYFEYPIMNLRERFTKKK